MLTLCVLAFTILCFVALIPQSLGTLFRSRTEPGWDYRGWPKKPAVYMPEGIPIPFFGLERLGALVMLVVSGVGLYSLIPPFYNAVHDLLLRG